MSNEEHLAILRRGIDAWNAWRSENRGNTPDLAHVGLDHASLAGADLSAANLTHTDLKGADLRGSRLLGADLEGADLSAANIAEADLRGADLTQAILSDANLFGSALNAANIHQTDLKGTNLRAALLFQVNFSSASLKRADFTQAYLGWTVFANIDLRGVIGLETVRHGAASTIGIDTIVRSEGQIPEVFLRGCGVPDRIIEYMASLVVNPIEFYSCFLSHSSADGAFAERLYSDLQNNGVRCWHYRHDMRGGKPWRSQIDEAIKVHDKLVLICLRESLLERNVVDEVVAAMKTEQETGSQKLFPIRLDDFILSREMVSLARERIASGTWPEDDWVSYARAYHIPDFSTWQTDYARYQAEFQRLLNDLKSPPRR